MKIIIIVFLLLSNLGLSAEKYAGEIFQMNSSVRNAAMGGCGLSDISSSGFAFWNSVLISSNEKLEIMHAEEYGGLLTYDSFSADLNGFSCVLTRVAIDDIPMTALQNPDSVLSANNRPYKYKLLNNSDVVAYFGFQRKISNFQVGITPKIVFRNLAEEKAFGFGSDISTIFNLNSNTSFALKFRDFFTTQIFWSNGSHEFVNPSLDAEISRNFTVFKKTTKLFLRTEIYVENRQTNIYVSKFSIDPHLGLSVAIHPAIEILGGYNINYFTAGVSYKWQKFRLNYSFENNSNLENSQKISLGYTL
ncbi:MAG: hypothetical protein HN952_04880 [Candidatus Cloacimonetes bacterium]|jgi:hypothetical protein|nr:hypothetical protein [Candidatus Cloacimonadota bacterium]MBT6994274.1 hypothetical protein [Candidatus Cloacimonadota bacterium]MBT7468974.1 hypothetical protein [Candidatus Cloacimonadota bacterium]